MTDMDISCGGTIIGLICNVAMALQDDLTAVQRDMALLEAALCSGEFEGVPLTDVIDILREEHGHAKRPLVDWYEQPRLIRGSPRAELRAADALVARVEMDVIDCPTFENLTRLALAKLRYRRIAELYGGEGEVLRQRKLRERSEDAKGARRASTTRLSNSQLARIKGNLEALILDCWSSRITPALFLERVKEMATAADGAIAAIVLAHCSDGDVIEKINKLGRLIRKRNHDRLAAQPAVEPEATKNTVPSDTDRAPAAPTVSSATMAAPDAAIPAEWPPRTGSLRDDDSAAEALEKWLSENPAKLRHLYQRAADGRISLKERPRSPSVADLFEKAIDHLNIQAALDDILRGFPA